VNDKYRIRVLKVVTLDEQFMLFSTHSAIHFFKKNLSIVIQHLQMYKRATKQNDGWWIWKKKISSIHFIRVLLPIYLFSQSKAGKRMMENRCLELQPLHTCGATYSQCGVDEWRKKWTNEITKLFKSLETDQGGLYVVYKLIYFSSQINI
jgi:hypothetical protein